MLSDEHCAQSTEYNHVCHAKCIASSLVANKPASSALGPACHIVAAVRLALILYGVMLSGMHASDMECVFIAFACRKCTCRPRRVLICTSLHVGLILLRFAGGETCWSRLCRWQSGTTTWVGLSSSASTVVPAWAHVPCAAGRGSMLATECCCQACPVPSPGHGDGHAYDMR